MIPALRFCARARLPSASPSARSIGYGYHKFIAPDANSSRRCIAHAPAFVKEHNWSPFFLFVIAASGIIGGSSVIAAENQQDVHATVRVDDSSKTGATKKKIVVLGSGWAGISFVKTLDTSIYDVHVISPRNFFVFTPLLPSVTVGTVEARSITEPIRKITKHKQNIKFIQANCTSIDSSNRKVICKPVANQDEIGKTEFEISFDYLVVAVGAQPNTFNTPGVEEYCHFLKEIEDAERIRESIVDFFELAALPFLSDDERRTLLQFVIIGGGPTGVEFAAELHDLIYEDLCKLYPNLIPFVNIVVVQSGDHILNMFDERISDFAEKKFRRDGIDVRTGCRVMAVQKNVIVTKEKKSGKTVEFPYGMAIWSTGIGTRPVIADFMKQIGQDNRRVLATDEWLRVKGCDNTYALGDCATIEQRKLLEDVAFIFKLADVDNSGMLSAKEFKDAIELLRGRYPQIDLYLKRQHMKDVLRIIDDNISSENKGEVLLDIEEFKKSLVKVDSQMKALPATAQVAAQQGEYLAKCFNRRSECEVEPEGPLRVRGEGRHLFRPFVYKHFGQFAPLGGEQAAAELPGDWVSLGRSTQWLWYSVYASKQVSWRTRALVIFDWTKRFVFGRDSSRM